MCRTGTICFAMSDRWLHFGIYFLLTTFGLIINVLLIWTVYRIIKAKNASTDVYIFVISHSTSAITYLSCNVLVMLPCMSIGGCEGWYPALLLKCLTSLNTIGYYATLFYVCIMTIERFLIFFKPDFHQFLMKYPRIILSTPWVLSGGILAATASLGCYKKFNEPTFQYITVCDDNNPVKKAIIAQVLFILGQAAPGLMFVLYAAIIAKVILLRRSHKLVNRLIIKNFTLALQFIIICIFQWFSAFFFFMVPNVYGTTLTGVLVTNLAGMLNPSINAIVMFSANGKVRENLPCLSCTSKKKRTVLISPGPLTGTHIGWDQLRRKSLNTRLSTQS